jgi:hypothetical protein
MAAAQHWDAAWTSVWPRIWVVASTATLPRTWDLASAGRAASMVPGTGLRKQKKRKGKVQSISYFNSNFIVQIFTELLKKNRERNKRSLKVL